MDALISEYGIATGTHHKELAGFVNDQLKEGWQPFGSVYSSQYDTQIFYHQPMVKYDIEMKKKTRSQK